jgi:PAS domain S-box-containing protein
MSRSDDTTFEAVAGEYAHALRDYVSGGGEAALMRAYELGRRAAAGGVGLLELALVHHEALVQAGGRGKQDEAALPMAAQFLAETLSPFEMTLRSYQANARMLGLAESSAPQNPELDRAREQLRTILDATTAIIYLKDAEGRYLFVNEQFQAVFGLRREQVIGKVDHDVLPPDVADMLHGDDFLVLEARAPREMEELLPTRDGAHTYLSLKFPLIDASGLPYGISCVATDITERKRTEEALQREKEAVERERQLKHAVEVRDRFLGIASHELKTPLTSLELQVQSLVRLGRADPDATLRDDRVEAKCDAIVRQVERMTTLINDLLDIGRIASGRLGLTRERVDLAELVRRVLAAVEDTARRSGSKVSLRVGAPAVGQWDARRIEAVVANLLSNAIKFGEGKPIDLTVDRSGDRAVLVVADHGMGISLDDQHRIFQRFERAVSEQHFGGFGLGLWVAREVIESHGGTVTVESVPGSGSIFRIDLPLDGT